MGGGTPIEKKKNKKLQIFSLALGVFPERQSKIGPNKNQKKFPLYLGKGKKKKNFFHKFRKILSRGQIENFLKTKEREWPPRFFKHFWPKKEIKSPLKI